MPIDEFIDHVVSFNDVSQILGVCKNQSDRGYVYERLWDLCIKFGFCDMFPNSDYIHVTGNVNNAKIKHMTTFKKYLKEKVYSGNSGGCSDITLYNKHTRTYVFISSKYPKNKNDKSQQKSVDYYDVQKLICMIDDNEHIYERFDIYLLVPNKRLVLEKVRNANKSSNHITKYMKETHMLDKRDLNICFSRFVAVMRSHAKGYVEYDISFLSPKASMSMRFHQELIVHKTTTLMGHGEKTFLWGCKCRSGKTYMLGGLILAQKATKKKINVLIITPVPNETLPQFTTEFFDRYAEFGMFSIHCIDGSMADNLVIDTDANNIFIASKQLLQYHIENQTFAKIKKLDLDIIGFDENHFGGTTELAELVVSTYASNNTVTIYLTATYGKPLHRWNIPDKCQMYWDISDEQLCKNVITSHMNMDKLYQKHGVGDVTHVLDRFARLGTSIDMVFAPYTRMPELCLITTMFDSQRYDTIKKNIMGSKYGFCFDVLFATNAQKTRFQYESEVKMVLRFISGSQKEIDYKDGDNSMFSRIAKICIDSDTRIPFTQIWFLPSDSINGISTCLERLMNDDGILKKYNILCVNRKNKKLAREIKDEITYHEQLARTTGKDGLILLAGNMLTLGISLEYCDVVMLMNNTLSCDKVMQQMFRCMTESTGKKYGFVIDLNISRVLNTCINYTACDKNKNTEEQIHMMVENHLINIDIDMMQHNKIDANTMVAKIMELWKSDPINNFKTLLRNLDNECVEFDTATQKLINKMFTSSIKDRPIDATIEIKNDTQQPLPSGKIVNTDSNKLVVQDIPDVDKMEIKISFTRDVLPHLLSLVCILTMKNTHRDFVTMLMDVQENPELLGMFDDMCLIWWGKKDMIDIVKKIVTQYFDKKSNIYNVSIVFKMSLQSLIDDPIKLIELIDECLKPKEVEKKKYGEVFTPLEFVNTMLDDLQAYYKATYNKNIYKNRKLKWADVAAGMGNFPIAIYYKLMDGLKKAIPDNEQRKKHIIENMLYMAEYNKKNCFILKQIFGIDSKYRINLYEGDSLQLDIKKTFGIKQFDIVIGNPPYNNEFKGHNGYAPALYNRFTEYYIDRCRMLCYVIPSRWFAGGRGLDGFRKMMLQRTDIAYIKHFDDASKIFGKKVDIKGGVNYFLKDRKYAGQCDYNGIMLNLNECDVLIDSKYLSLISRLDGFKKLATCYRSKGYFGIPLTDKRLHDVLAPDDVKCFVSQMKGSTKYIKSSTLPEDKLGKWQVITPSASYGANSGFGNLILGMPEQVYSETYISFAVDSQSEANSLVSYMKCRLPNMLLSIRKNSQNISKDTCKWIPLPQLDTIWDDAKLYRHFGLTPDDICMVEATHIVGRTDNKPKDIGHTGIVPIGSDRMPIGSDRMPIGSDVVPIGSDSMPIGSDGVKIERIRTKKKTQKNARIGKIIRVTKAKD